jgi:carboxyl-terminal processing protease
VGQRTAGHGTLQSSSPYRLSDGSAISITIATLLTGRDKSYDQTGLTPDVEASGDQVTAAMLVNPAPAQDAQILRAFEVARAMVRERGGDPGTGMDPPATSLPADDSGAAPEGGEAASGDTSGFSPEDGSQAGDDPAVG